jgi:adenylate cyclase class 2
MTDLNETEIKLRVAERVPTVERIMAAGYEQSAARVFEANTVFDTPDQRLRGNDMLLRLRQVGSTSILTWKGPGIPGPHKSRPELETSVDSGEALAQVFRHLGYDPMFRYEKYRTEFRKTNSPGVVTFDETPIGNFLELEGPAEWIDKTAAELGFAPKEYILDSYGKLYLADCERRGVPPGHMVFAPTAG